jgi:hypothetical protein
MGVGDELGGDEAEVVESLVVQDVDEDVAHGLPHGGGRGVDQLTTGGPWWAADVASRGPSWRCGAWTMRAAGRRSGAVVATSYAPTVRRGSCPRTPPTASS